MDHSELKLLLNALSIRQVVINHLIKKTTKNSSTLDSQEKLYKLKEERADIEAQIEELKKQYSEGT